MWSIIDNEQSDLQFTYNVFYCYKPSFANLFCRRPPHGFNIFEQCSDLSINSSVSGMVMKCNVTSLFKKFFPSLFGDVHEQISGRPIIFFTINFGNVRSYSYGKISYCNPLKSGIFLQLTLDNSNFQGRKRFMLSGVWKTGIANSE